MPGNPREMITVAERRLPVRIRIGVPPGRLGQRYSEITAWLDQNCDADGWAITPSGMRGVLNDAISVYFAEATCQRLCPPWCVGSKVETAGGVFQVQILPHAARPIQTLHTVAWQNDRIKCNKNTEK